MSTNASGDICSAACVDVTIGKELAVWLAKVDRCMSSPKTTNMLYMFNDNDSDEILDSSPYAISILTLLNLVELRLKQAQEVFHSRSILLRKMTESTNMVTKVVCSILQQSLPVGVCYHHAQLLGDEKKLLENAFRNRELLCICCTTTLAAGVNLPCRRVLLRTMKGGLGEYMDVAKFLQICGRAGRQGYDSIGECVIFVEEKKTWGANKLRKMNSDPHAHLRSNDLVNSSDMRQLTEYLLGQLPPLRSSLTGKRLQRALLDVFVLELLDWPRARICRDFVNNTLRGVMVMEKDSNNTDSKHEKLGKNQSEENGNSEASLHKKETQEKQDENKGAVVPLKLEELHAAREMLLSYTEAVKSLEDPAIHKKRLRGFLMGGDDEDFMTTRQREKAEQETKRKAHLAIRRKLGIQSNSVKFVPKTSGRAVPTNGGQFGNGVVKPSGTPTVSVLQNTFTNNTSGITNGNQIRGSTDGDKTSASRASEQPGCMETRFMTSNPGVTSSSEGATIAKAAGQFVSVGAVTAGKFAAVSQVTRNMFGKHGQFSSEEARPPGHVQPSSNFVVSSHPPEGAAQQAISSRNPKFPSCSANMSDPKNHSTFLDPNSNRFGLTGGQFNVVGQFGKKAENICGNNNESTCLAGGAESVVELPSGINDRDAHAHHPINNNQGGKSNVEFSLTGGQFGKSGGQFGRSGGQFGKNVGQFGKIVGHVPDVIRNADGMFSTVVDPLTVTPHNAKAGTDLTKSPAQSAEKEILARELNLLKGAPAMFQTNQDATVSGVGSTYPKSNLANGKAPGQSTSNAATGSSSNFTNSKRETLPVLESQCEKHITCNNDASVVAACEHGGNVRSANSIAKGPDIVFVTPKEAFLFEIQCSLIHLLQHDFLVWLPRKGVKTSCPYELPELLSKKPHECDRQGVGTKTSRPVTVDSFFGGMSFIRGEETHCLASCPFGDATTHSQILCKEAAILYKDLFRARRNGIILSSELHQLYLCTPISNCLDLKVDWKAFKKMLGRFSPTETRVANAVGINIRFIEEQYKQAQTPNGAGVANKKVKALLEAGEHNPGSNGSIFNSEVVTVPSVVNHTQRLRSLQSNPLINSGRPTYFGHAAPLGSGPPQPHTSLSAMGSNKHTLTLLTHMRFFLALILYSIVHERGVVKIADQFKVSRGEVQALQNGAGMFCGTIISFCQRLRWWKCEWIFKNLQPRMDFGVSDTEILPLVGIGIAPPRARILHQHGLSVEKLALVRDAGDLERYMAQYIDERDDNIVNGMPASMQNIYKIRLRQKMSRQIIENARKKMEERLTKIYDEVES